MNTNPLIVDENAHQYVPDQQEKQNPIEFEPSIATKNNELYTKTKSRRIAGVRLPGIYGLYQFPLTILAVFIMLLSEILIGYISSNDAGVEIFVIAGTIMADILFAFLGHLREARRKRLENEIVLAQGVNLEQKELELKACKRWYYFFSILIVLSGLLKLYFFQDSWGAFDATSWLVLICVIVSCIINVFVTGYFLYTIYYLIKLRGERNAFAKSGGTQYAVVDYNPQPINNEGIILKELQIGHHRIYKKDGVYYLDTYGILTDKQLVEFANRQQSSSAKIIVAKACLQAQLDSLNN